MTGPHTKVRVDAGAGSPEKAGKAKGGAQQTGLAKFYKGMVFTPCDEEHVLCIAKEHSTPVDSSGI
jgi:hypothetical protein